MVCRADWKAMIRDAGGLLWPDVDATLRALDLKPEDDAVRKLAARYAQIIDQLPDKAPRGGQDQAWAARWLFPLLLDCLTELGATPAARARLTKGGKPADGKPNRLAQLRAARGA
jgi:hypothetical protein